MGPGNEATAQDVNWAESLGALIAKNGWVLLSGGRDAGVMDAVSRAAHAEGGLVIGVLPTADLTALSAGVDIAIVTGMASARNNINVLSSDVVVACGTTKAGTLSEIALALKAQKDVVLLNDDENAVRFLSTVGPDRIHPVDNPEAAIEICRSLLDTAPDHQ